MGSGVSLLLTLRCGHMAPLSLDANFFFLGEASHWRRCRPPTWTTSGAGTAQSVLEVKVGNLDAGL